MQITVRREVQFGNERFFPENGETSFICKLMKAKSLTIEHLKMMKDFGWNIEFIEKKVEL